MTSRNTAKKFIILDGGLGTTLQDVFHVDTSNALWSGQPIRDDPETIIAAHLAFLNAGARIILTATYQCASCTFERAGYTSTDARETMLAAVHLAYTAKQRFLASQPDIGASDVQIALSLGSYGGVVDGLHEFDGIYPPPYGPTADLARNTFTEEEKARGDEERSVVALQAFYAERLEVFLSDAETWDMIDWVAFETVPLIREVHAIRRAMGALGEAHRKPWWISNVFPTGKLPEATNSAAESTTQALVHALLAEASALPAPDAIGINCTSVAHVDGVLDVMVPAIGRLGLAKKPWLVLYPNGGDWDREAHSWALNKGAGDWVNAVKNIAKAQMESDVWEKIVVGGCCKISPQDIRALVKELES